LLGRIDCSRLQHLVAAHLSERNNDPERVHALLGALPGSIPGCISVASQERGFDWCCLS